MKNKTQQNTGWLDKYSEEILQAQNGSVIENTFVKKPKVGTTVNEAVNKKGVEAKRFLNQWMDSPMYTKMIKHSDPDNYQNLTNWRKNNLQTANIHYNSNQLFEDSAGFSNKLSGNVTILPEGKNLNDVETHEFSHSSDRPQVEINKYKRAIPKSDINLIEKYKKSNTTDIDDEDYINYVTEPTETRARLNSIRQQAKKQGVYNPFKEKVTPEQYKKLLKTNSSSDEFNPLYQLKNAYRDSQIINLLNSVSQNEEPQQEVSTAQTGKTITHHKNGKWLSKFEQGGIIKDDNGYWNPDNWGKDVEINSPDITMEEVYEPLIGTSKETGEKKMMLPGKNYKFANTKKVIETPMKNWLNKYKS